MKRVVLGLLLVVACKPTPPAGSGEPPHPVARRAPENRAANAPADAASAEEPSCIEDAKPYDEAVLRARLAAIAAKELDGRAPGTAGDRAVRALIAERFRCLGLTPAGDGESFAQAFTHGTTKTANVIGYIAGSDEKVGAEIIVVGAHHDHLGAGFLGANDNASGVVALLAIAQALQQRDVGPRRTIAFVTFGAEEEGLVGSRHYVTRPPAALPLARVVQVINLDMLGSYSSRNAVHAFGTFPRFPARALLETAAAKHPELHVGLGGHSVRGDHHFFCRRRIPYVFFWTPDSRCYHQKCDTADKIDYPSFAKITSIAGELVRGLADSELDLAKSRETLGCRGPRR